jgi:hypothetical protein
MRAAHCKVVEDGSETTPSVRHGTPGVKRTSGRSAFLWPAQVGVETRFDRAKSGGPERYGTFR